MAHGKQGPGEPLVELVQVQGELAAEVLTAMLEAEGIYVATGAQVTASVLPFTVNGLGRVRLYVRPEDLGVARAVIDTRPPDHAAPDPPQDALGV